jgi:Cu/Zn superoxide dismutase
MGKHFIGECNQCRPEGSPQEVGDLNNGIPLISVGNTSNDVTWVETVAKLWGVNSILGRGVGIHAAGNSMPRLAQCIVGTITVDAQYDFIGPPPNVTQAGCMLVPTEHSSITGRVNFTSHELQGATATPGLTVSWGVSQGLQNGNNGFHVHAYGDITDMIGAFSTGGHFFGACSDATPCRPAWANEQEVGMLFNNGYINGSTTTAIMPDGTVTQGGGHFLSSFGQMQDNVVSMSLPGRAIVGRSVVIHQGKNAPREAQCIIGITSPATAPAIDCKINYQPWDMCSCSAAATVVRTLGAYTSQTETLVSFTGHPRQNWSRRTISAKWWQHVHAAAAATKLSLRCVQFFMASSFSVVHSVFLQMKHLHLVPKPCVY